MFALGFWKWVHHARFTNCVTENWSENLAEKLGSVLEQGYQRSSPQYCPWVSEWPTGSMGPPVVRAPAWFWDVSCSGPSGKGKVEAGGDLGPCGSTHKEVPPGRRDSAVWGVCGGDPQRWAGEVLHQIRNRGWSWGLLRSLHCMSVVWGSCREGGCWAPAVAHDQLLFLNMYDRLDPWPRTPLPGHCAPSTAWGRQDLCPAHKPQWSPRGRVGMVRTEALLPSSACRQGDWKGQDGAGLAGAAQPWSSQSRTVPHAAPTLATRTHAEPCWV